MGKRNSRWTIEKYEEFIKKRNWDKVLCEYEPTINIQAFPSTGRVSRIKGWKTNRIHHLFSDIQTRYFYTLDWSDQVMDIREHFPLMDIELQDGLETSDLRLDIFADKESGVPYIKTSTFLITVENNSKEIYIARSVKAASSLEKGITLEGIEIERRYWESKGVDFGIVTQYEIDKEVARNVEWVHNSKFYSEDIGIPLDQFEFLRAALLDDLGRTEGRLDVCLTSFDQLFKLDRGTGLMLFKHLIANKLVGVDMFKRIDISRIKIEDIVIKQEYSGRTGGVKHVGS